MITKVRVRGKALNRTALGIMHAYMVMHPESTLAELREAFPNSLKQDAYSEIFTVVERNSAPDTRYFTKEDELLQNGSNVHIAVSNIWSENSYQALVEKAKEYNIHVVYFERTNDGYSTKGWYSLEYVNGYDDAPIDEENNSTALYGGDEDENNGSKKCKCPCWITWVLAALFILFLILFCFAKCSSKKPQKVLTRTVHDTVYVQQSSEGAGVSRIQAAQFKKNRAVLNDGAKLALHDLGNILRKNKDLKITIIGHASEEGTAVYNQKLSERRAKAVADYLVKTEKISSSRMTTEGHGERESIAKARPLNRRVEIRVK